MGKSQTLDAITGQKLQYTGSYFQNSVIKLKFFPCQILYRDLHAASLRKVSVTQEAEVKDYEILKLFNLNYMPLVRVPTHPYP